MVGMRQGLNAGGWLRLAGMCWGWWVGAGALRAADWPQWRGPDRNGISMESAWSADWPAAGPKIAWRARVGLGFAAVSVMEGRVVTTGHDDGKDHVVCFEGESGRELWRHSFPSELGDRFFEGGTTGTPTISGGRVYVLNRWGDTFCLDLVTGKPVWHRNVAELTEARVPDWGFGGSPVVEDGRVFLNVGEGGLALSAKDGEILWKSGTRSAGYSTPVFRGEGEQRWMVVGTAQGYAAVRPSDGTEVWRIRWLTQYGVNAADPIIEGDQMFLSTGYGKGGAMFRLGKGEPELVWKTKVLRTQMNPAVLWKGHLYGVDGDTTERASLKCVEFGTGTEKWSQAGFGSGGVMVAGERLVALSGSGELMVGEASPAGFDPVARAQVLGGKSWTVPVLAGGRIHCRNSRGEVVVVDVRMK